jgi:hypothetical protein
MGVAIPIASKSDFIVKCEKENWIAIMIIRRCLDKVEAQRIVQPVIIDDN